MPSALLAVLLAASQAPGAAAQEAIVDTSRPFTPGAVERPQELRGPVGWATYQEGIADGLAYRFDPDGYARFSLDERLAPEDAWDVVCTSWPTVSCSARRGDIMLALSRTGQVVLSVEGLPADTMFVPEGSEEAPRSLLELSQAADAGILSSLDALVPAQAQGSPALPITGLLTVIRYLRWVNAGGEPAAVMPQELVPDPQSVPPEPIMPEPGAEQVAPPSPQPQPLPVSELPSPAPSGTEAPSPAHDDAGPRALGPGAMLVLPAPQPTQATPAPAVQAPKTIVEPMLPVSAPAPTPHLNQKLALRRHAAAVMTPIPGSAAILPVKAAALSCPVPPRSPDEPLGDAVDSLHGLTAVRVFTDYLAEPDELKGKLRWQLRRRVEDRLKSVGLRVLTKEEAEAQPGKPRLEFYLSGGDRASGCPFRISISLRQEVALGREAGTRLYGATWSEAGPSRLGFSQGAEIETFSFYMESFITDWRAVNSGQPRERAGGQRTKPPEPTRGQWVSRALSVSSGVSVPMKAADDAIMNSLNNLGQDREPPGTPTFSTTLGLSWPGTPWFARLTLYRYLEPSKQQPWNPDFSYTFGYDDYRPNTFSLTYGNYGGNRFNPDEGEAVTEFKGGSFRAAYKFNIEDKLIAPWVTEETRLFSCQPAVTTTPQYFDQTSNSDESFKTSLSFGCRYNIWRSAFIGATAFVYPDASQQQDWDPDYTYSFGWSNWRPGTFSLEYGNSSGNRWPWRQGGSGIADGGISLSYRIPLDTIIDWFAEP